MAICKFGTSVTGIRGTLGGATYSANKAGPYLRAWRMPALSQTSLQTRQRAALSRYGQLWRGMTSSLRADWGTWAALAAQARTNALGETYYLSGWQQFVAINQARFQVALAPTTAVPTIAMPNTPTILTLSAYATGGSANTTMTVNTNAFALKYGLVFAMLVNSIGIYLVPRSWRLIWYTSATSATSFNLQTAVDATFGLARVGQRLILRAHAQSLDGLRTSYTALGADVQA